MKFLLAIPLLTLVSMSSFAASSQILPLVKQNKAQFSGSLRADCSCIDQVGSETAQKIDCAPSELPSDDTQLLIFEVFERNVSACGSSPNAYIGSSFGTSCLGLKTSTVDKHNPQLTISQSYDNAQSLFTYKAAEANGDSYTKSVRFLSSDKLELNLAELKNQDGKAVLKTMSCQLKLDTQ